MYNIKMNQNSDLCTIYFVRHGETDWNVQGKMQGHTDVPLNATGEVQAHELREKFKDIKFDTVFSSDLQRAKKTAEIISLEHDLALQTTKALRERSYGEFEGRTKEEVQVIINNLLVKLADEEKRSAKLFPEQENDEEVVSRVVTFLREIAIANSGKIILIVSHGGVVRELLEHFGYGGQNYTGNLKISNGAYIKFESDGVDFFIREVVGVTQ